MSIETVSTTAARLPASRVILGPLTTTFTAPVGCMTPIGCTTCHDAWQAQACSTDWPMDAKSCWPPATDGAADPHQPFAGWGFYSPGLICPNGHYSACSATGMEQTSEEWSFQFQLKAAETAVGCCPIGYACYNLEFQAICHLIVESTVVQMGTCDGTTAVFNALTLPDTGRGLSSMKLWAPLVQINHMSSDLSSTTTVSPTANPQPQQPIATGLSSGASAGIAVVAVLLGIALITTAFLLWRRYRRRYNLLKHNATRSAELSAQPPECNQADMRGERPFQHAKPYELAHLRSPVELVASGERHQHGMREMRHGSI